MPDVGNELRRLVERLPVAAVLAVFDEPQSIVLVNEPFVRMFGYTLADIPTVGAWAAHAYPDERYRREVFSAWDAAVAKARAETGRVESMEFRVTRKDGAIRDIVFAAAVIGAGLMVTVIDVSKRRQAEAELRQTRSRLERTAYEITENIPVGTYTMVQPPGGGIGSFQFMSRRFLDMCGLDAEEARSDPFKVFSCVHPDDYDEWVRKNAEVFAKKLPFHEECRVLVGEEVRWVSAVCGRHPQAACIVLSSAADEFACPSEFAGQVVALIDKTAPLETLRSQVEAVVRRRLGDAGGRTSADPALVLRPRELEVFERIGQGMTTRAIAESLGITMHTVNSHRKAIVAKVGAVGADLVRLATVYNQTRRSAPASRRDG
jgi:PAS domain S-box-containing protein